MAASRGIRLVTLGWQTWSVVVVVLTLVMLVGLLILAW
jgi:hypothetical protein